MNYTKMPELKFQIHMCRAAVLKGIAVFFCSTNFYCYRLVLVADKPCGDWLCYVAKYP